MIPLPLLGTAHAVASGGYTAEFSTRGAALRALTFHGRPLVPAVSAGPRPHFNGVIMAPWPNRVVDGRYNWEGSVQQLELSEPERRHALHGLLTSTDFEVAERGATHITLTAAIAPQAGYPFKIQVAVTYSVGRDGLSVRLTATNTGESRAPFGSGGHPYLVAGDGKASDWLLHVPAESVLMTAGARLIPSSLVPVRGTGLDFRRPQRVGGTVVDHAFTGLIRDSSGAVRVRVTDSSGRGAELAMDGTSSWLQIYTSDSSIAVEPMTCAPDAFNSAAGLVVLQPGESLKQQWWIRGIQ